MLNKIMEMFWLALGTVMILLFAYMSWINGFSYEYFIALLPFAMFGARRFVRKKMEKPRD